MNLFDLLLAKQLGGDSGGGITPSGTIPITENGTHDVTQYAEADVNVEPALTTLNVTANGTYRIGEIIAYLGYDGWDEVVVNVPASAVRKASTITVANDITTGTTIPIEHGMDVTPKMYFCSVDLSDNTYRRYAGNAYIPPMHSGPSNGVLAPVFLQTANSQTVSAQNFTNSPAPTSQYIYVINSSALNVIKAGTVINWEAYAW